MNLSETSPFGKCRLLTPRAIRTLRAPYREIASVIDKEDPAKRNQVLEDVAKLDVLVVIQIFPILIAIGSTSFSLGANLHL
jgi:hypothetical protein